jgi:hypothetical protein
MENEKRKAKRITYMCEVECVGAEVPSLRTRITDLSTAGVFIDSLTCFAVGSILRLKFRINDTLIEATGEVRYCMPQIGMGVRFSDLSPEQRAIIEDLVEGKPSNHSEPVAVGSTGELVPPPSVANVLSGNFAVVSLFDIIQMIEHGRLTGRLQVKLPSAGGEMLFNNGRIVGAAAGMLAGEAALSRLLGATEGTFEFQKSDQEFEQIIESKSNAALLLNLLSSKDEEKPVLTPQSDA